jgi:hypothetical protein
MRSERPELAAPLKTQWPLPERSWKDGGNGYRVLGVVIMACIPEG